MCAMVLLRINFIQAAWFMKKNSVLLTSLNAGVKYWYCIDSFNESGITEGEISMMNI